MITTRKQISKKIRFRFQVYQKYQGHCAYCGCSIALNEMQVDHLTSLYQDGKDDISNYMPSCRMCNSYKRTMTIENFRKQLGLLQGRLDKSFIYRLSKKYGLLNETPQSIKFYFEKEKTND